MTRLWEKITILSQRVASRSYGTGWTFGDDATNTEATEMALRTAASIRREPALSSAWFQTANIFTSPH